MRAIQNQFEKKGEGLAHIRSPKCSQMLRIYANQAAPRHSISKLSSALGLH